MDKKERYALFIILFIVAISIFLMALRGRYQIVTIGPGYPVSHDTWTGRVYIGGTNDIYNRPQEAQEKQQKRSPRDLLKEAVPENQ